MKKFFFLACVLLLIPVVSYGSALAALDNNQTTLREFFDKYIQTNNLNPKVVLFHQKRVHQIPEPIIKYEAYEALETLKKIVFTPVVSTQRDVVLLILTTILLFLTIARRRQIEKWQEATRPC